MCYVKNQLSDSQDSWIGPKILSGVCVGVVVVVRVVGCTIQYVTAVHHFADLSEEDFASSVWQHLLRPLSRRSSLALLVIDVQNDFISGSLALKDAPAKQGENEERDISIVYTRFPLLP